MLSLCLPGGLNFVVLSGHEMSPTLNASLMFMRMYYDPSILTLAWDIAALAWVNAVIATSVLAWSTVVTAHRVTLTMEAPGVDLIRLHFQCLPGEEWSFLWLLLLSTISLHFKVGFELMFELLLQLKPSIVTYKESNLFFCQLKSTIETPMLLYCVLLCVCYSIADNKEGILCCFIKNRLPNMRSYYCGFIQFLWC